MILKVFHCSFLYIHRYIVLVIQKFATQKEQIYYV